MKDFIKWLGVNEKIAKVVVWFFIFTVMLITINAALRSTGFSNYAISYDNMVKIPISKVLGIASNIIVTLANFYSMALLVFKINEAKKIFKYSILYIILNAIVTIALHTLMTQIFIIVYMMVFAYSYSNKQKKYILYMLISIIINILVEGLTYTTKMIHINFEMIDNTTKAILSIDYFIIMAIIILVKEVYLKKRGEKNGRLANR